MVAQHLSDLVAGDSLASSNEDRVLAGDRPGDVAEHGRIDCVGERRRVAGRCLYDDELPGRLDRGGEPAQRGRQLVEAVEVAAARKRVDEPAVLAAHLHEPQLVDVARHGRLYCLDALRAECFHHLALRRDRTVLHEAEDRALPVVLGHMLSMPAYRIYASAYVLVRPCRVS